jgi:large subunit ribosomal protein L15
MSLNNLRPAPGSRPSKHIVGRGEGSGWGQTAGKGQKGQKSRTGDTIMIGFEGGQTPMVRRIPKRGFNHPSKIHYQAVNLFQLEALFKAGESVNGESLAAKGLIKKASWPYKILGDGKLTKALTISASKFSKSAEEAVKKAGGSFVAIAAAATEKTAVKAVVKKTATKASKSTKKTPKA